MIVVWALARVRTRDLWFWVDAVNQDRALVPRTGFGTWVGAKIPNFLNFRNPSGLAADTIYLYDITYYNMV